LVKQRFAEFSSNTMERPLGGVLTREGQEKRRVGGLFRRGGGAEGEMEGKLERWKAKGEEAIVVGGEDVIWCGTGRWREVTGRVGSEEIYKNKNGGSEDKLGTGEQRKKARW